MRPMQPTTSCLQSNTVRRSAPEFTFRTSFGTSVRHGLVTGTTITTKFDVVHPCRVEASSLQNRMCAAKKLGPGQAVVLAVSFEMVHFTMQGAPT